MNDILEPFRADIALHPINGRLWLSDRYIVKALSVSAEAEYLRGSFWEAKRQLAAAAFSIRRNQLISREKVHGHEEQRLRRQQIWLIACYAGACIRVGLCEIAQEYLDAARAFVINYLKDDDTFPCYGTLARIDYYTGLLARNSGDLIRARKCFDRATELAIARCKQALEGKNKTTEDQNAEVLFRRRCLARVQAFGYGLCSLSEGKLLNARASFYFALELLQNTGSELADDRLYHDELMANQVWLWLILVRTMLIPFTKDGINQLNEMQRTLIRLREWFSLQTGEFDPYRRLCKALYSFVQLRLHQIHNEPIVELFSYFDTPQKQNRHWETDVTTLITKLVAIWVAIDSNPALALQLIPQVDAEHITLPFWKNEIQLAAAEAHIEADTIIIKASKGTEVSPETENNLLRVISFLDKIKGLSHGQSIFANVFKARACLLLAECCSACAHSSSGSEYWGHRAASISIDLRQQSVHSGVLAWKIRHLPTAHNIPTRLPLPDEVRYPLSHLDLFLLIAGRNAIVECIRKKPELNKKDMAEYLKKSIGLTPQRAREYFDAFADLRNWLIPKGIRRKRCERHRDIIIKYKEFLDGQGF